MFRKKVRNFYSLALAGVLFVRKIKSRLVKVSYFWKTLKNNLNKNLYINNGSENSASLHVQLIFLCTIQPFLRFYFCRNFLFIFSSLCFFPVFVLFCQNFHFSRFVPGWFETRGLQKKLWKAMTAKMCAEMKIFRPLHDFVACSQAFNFRSLNTFSCSSKV